MSLLKPIAIAAIASLIAAPGYAERANPAAKLSLTPPAAAPDRMPSKVRSAEKLESGTLLLIAGGVAVVVIAAVLLGDNDSSPASN